MTSFPKILCEFFLDVFNTVWQISDICKEIFCIHIYLGLVRRFDVLSEIICTYFVLFERLPIWCQKCFGCSWYCFADFLYFFQKYFTCVWYWIDDFPYAKYFVVSCNF